MRDAASTALILPGSALFVFAAIALWRLRSRAVGLAFLTTRNAALVGMAAAFGMCTAGGAIAPPEQKVAHVETTPSTAQPRRFASEPKREHITSATTTSTTRATTTTMRPVANTRAFAAVATTRPYVPPTAPPRTAPPPTAPPATAAPKPAGAPCHPSYDPCIPDEGTDVDCRGNGGDGPRYVNGPVYVSGHDEYGLDRDGNGVGCQS